MNIHFVISSLRSGGAERVVSRLANYWAAQGHDVSIVTVESSHSDFYDLHHKVKRIGLGLHAGGRLWAKPFRMIRRVRALRNTFAQGSPDVILSFLTTINIMTVVACVFMRVPLILSERTNPRFQKIPLVTRVMRRILYPLAEKVVFVSRGVANQFSWLPKENCSVIYNPIDVQSVPVSFEGLPFPQNRSFFLAIGRLELVKGYDLLLKAYAKIAESFPEWDLLILGDGEERSALSHQAQELGISDRVFMPGRIKNTRAAIRSCGGFVLSSRYEGFPNALVEAMAEGVPVVSFDCQYGPSEIITHMVSGVLVPQSDIDGLANAMAFLACDEKVRSRIGEEGKRGVQKLAIGNIARAWEALIVSMIGRDDKFP